MTRAWLLAIHVLALAAGCSMQDDDSVSPDAAISVSADARRPDAAIDAPAVVGTTCAMKEPVVQLIYTCNFVWSQCSGTGGTAPRTLDCSIQAAGTLRFSLCDCRVNGVSQKQFTSTTICGSASWAELETATNTQCDWDLK